MCERKTVSVCHPIGWTKIITFNIRDWLTAETSDAALKSAPERRDYWTTTLLRQSQHRRLLLSSNMWSYENEPVLSLNSVAHSWSTYMFGSTPGANPAIHSGSSSTASSSSPWTSALTDLHAQQPQEEFEGAPVENTPAVMDGIRGPPHSEFITYMSDQTLPSKLSHVAEGEEQLILSNFAHEPNWPSSDLPTVIAATSTTPTRMTTLSTAWTDWKNNTNRTSVDEEGASWFAEDRGVQNYLNFLTRNSHVTDTSRNWSESDVTSGHDEGKSITPILKHTAFRSIACIDRIGSEKRFSGSQLLTCENNWNSASHTATISPLVTCVKSSGKRRIPRKRQNSHSARTTVSCPTQDSNEPNATLRSCCPFERPVHYSECGSLCGLTYPQYVDICAKDAASECIRWPKPTKPDTHFKKECSNDGHCNNLNNLHVDMPRKNNISLELNSSQVNHITPDTGSQLIAASAASVTKSVNSHPGLHHNHINDAYNHQQMLTPWCFPECLPSTHDLSTSRSTTNACTTQTQQSTTQTWFDSGHRQQIDRDQYSYSTSAYQTVSHKNANDRADSILSDASMGLGVLGTCISPSCRSDTNTVTQLLCQPPNQMERVQLFERLEFNKADLDARQGKFDFCTYLTQRTMSLARAKAIYLNGDYEYAAQAKCRNWQSTEPSERALTATLPIEEAAPGLLAKENTRLVPCSNFCRMLCIQLAPADV
ncbi:hypothetical protein AHF37_00257 [Paragonimus kellicotti]|nr:hypothetical protein AHF37_00257 [Paragonimus kellicotti]